MSQTLFDRIWAQHEVSEGLLYIDLHLVHEVTSPQAFDGLRLAGRQVRRPDRTLATADHNVPTDGTPVAARIRDELSRVQVETLERNCEEFGITLYSMGSDRQGIVHVIGPELGVTQPGMTIVCGDSHTATHGAFGALAFGIGTSEVEHVLATQCLAQGKPKSMRIRYEGEPGFGVTAKDLILGTIGQMGTNGAAGHVVEYAGPAIEALSMEGRMTICNMTIEGGGRAGMVAPDDTTFEWIEGRPGAPEDLDAAIDAWRELRTDDDASFDRELTVDAGALSPLVTWGTTPAMVVPVTEQVPEPRSDGDQRALKYMGLEAGTPMQEIRLDRVFIGSCTNSRIGDLRAAAALVEGRKVASDVHAMVVPGSQPVAAQAEAEGLDEVFRAAGFDWRTAGCSMCLGMNPDILQPGERCASTSNRNFEGRQGRGGRTHLVSPQMAAAAAIEGHFVDIRDWDLRPNRRPWRPKWSRPGHLRRRVRARPRRRRHRPDHPQAVPQARRAHRLRRVPLLRLEARGRLGPAAQPDPRHRAELRLRLEPRARAVGARGLRLQGRRRRLVRRHLLLQLHEDRPAPGRDPRGRGQGADGRPARPRSTSRRSRCASTAAPSRSSCTPRSGGACSRASTTSASRSSTTTRSRPTRPSGRGGSRRSPIR